MSERLALAHTGRIGHAELVLADEVNHRETRSVALRGRTAGHDPAMTFYR